MLVPVRIKFTVTAIGPTWKWSVFQKAKGGEPSYLDHGEAGSEREARAAVQRSIRFLINE